MGSCLRLAHRLFVLFELGQAKGEQAAGKRVVRLLRHLPPQLLSGHLEAPLLKQQLRPT